ncbi:MFS transporter [Paenibacillus thalictri]|uniref:MFS transporter n=1 Tax=Paenibacillus thalictri TaxID=2527873 RepID=A0A4Q9DLE9_9BACL|nr:MFS transporter [Paenibacillus thalictri]TBL75766.1 MFS transporter [Paenibacillus thalictri]
MGAETKSFKAAHMILYGTVLFMIEFVRGAYLVSFLPTYAVNVLGFTAAVVGISVSVHYAMDTLIKCYAGYLLDRFPIRWIIQVGLLISLAGLLFMQYAQQLWVLIAAAALFGVGISPFWLVCLSKVKPEHRAANMGLLYTCWLSGIGAGPVVINFLIDKSYTLSFRIMIMIWIAAWLLSLLITNVKQSAEVQIPIKRQLVLLWERLYTMRVLLPGMILQTAAAGMLVPILPGFAAKYLGLHYSEYSYVLLAGGAFAVIFLVPMGKLADRFGRRWFLVPGFAAFALALYAISLATLLWQALVLAACIGLSYAAVLPSWNALIAQYVPKNQQGLGWGLFSSIEGIGVIIGPVIGGWIADAAGERLALWVSAALLAAIAVYYVLMPPEKVKERA